VADEWEWDTKEDIETGDTLPGGAGFGEEALSDTLPDMAAASAGEGAALGAADAIPVVGAFAAGYEVGTALWDHLGVTSAIHDHFLPHDVPPPEGQTEPPPGHGRGHWVYDPATPDIDKVWVDDPS
jgi:hypothetical protein